MDAVIEFLGKSVEPGSARMRTFGVEMMEKSVGGHWWGVFEWARTGAEFPFLGLNVFFEWKGERTFENAKITVFEAELRIWLFWRR